MGLGIDVRLSRLFSHPSGNLFGIAVDHFVGYGNVREGGLSNLPRWVGLAIAGTLLVLAGARIEWLRRESRRAVGWLEGLR